MRYNEWDRNRWVRKKNIMNERESDNEWEKKIWWLREKEIMNVSKRDNEWERMR